MNPLVHALCLLPLGSPIQVEGPTYRAAFDREGATFTPTNARGVDDRATLRLVPTSLGRERGGAFAAFASPAPGVDETAGRTPRSVHYVRGPGVVERWHARDDGVELTYTFAARPAGRGDLVVRLRVETDLLPRFLPWSDADEGLRWGGGRTGAAGVRIGGVTGIDAGGRTCPGSLRREGSMLELRLPAAFVDGASYPLVLDPLIGADFSVDPGGNQARPAVAYEAGNQRFLVVWQEEFDPTNARLVARFLDAAGNPLGGSFLVRGAPGLVVLGPTVASVRANGRFVVAWIEAPNLLGPWQIACRGVNADGSLSSVTSLGATSADLPGPRLGTNASVADAGVLLVTNTYQAVRAQRLTVPTGSGPPTPVGSPTIVDSGGLVVRLRATTHTGGVPGRWVLVWHRTNLTNPPTSLLARAVGPNANLLGSELDLGSSTAGWHAIDGEGSNFLLGWVSAGDVFCRRLQWSGSTLVANGAEEPVTNAPSGKSDLVVSHLGPKVLLAWSDDGGTFLGNDVRGLAIDPTTCRACDLPFAVPRPTRYDIELAVASQASSSPIAGDEALVVWNSSSLVAPFDGEIAAQRFEAFGPGGAFTNLGGGCGPPITLQPNGPLSLGNLGFSVQVLGLPGPTTVFLGVGLPGQTPIPCGPCLVTPPLLLLPVATAGTRGAIGLPLGCDPALVGGQLELQAWVVTPAASPCPLVATLSFTDRWVATVGQ